MEEGKYRFKKANKCTVGWKAKQKQITITKQAFT
jgi:hypothetical protein